MNKESTKALALFTQIAISMLVPIFICFFVGYGIDKLVGTQAIFLIIFTVVGVLAGFRSVYVLVQSFFKDKDTFVDMNKIKSELQKQSDEEEDKDNDR